MAAKTNKTSELDQQTATITAGSNEYVSDANLKQKLLDVMIAKTNALAAPQKNDNTASIAFGILILVFLIAMIYKKRQQQPA